MITSFISRFMVHSDLLFEGEDAGLPIHSGVCHNESGRSIRNYACDGECRAPLTNSLMEKYRSFNIMRSPADGAFG